MTYWAHASFPGLLATVGIGGRFIRRVERPLVRLAPENLSRGAILELSAECSVGPPTRSRLPGFWPESDRRIIVDESCCATTDYADNLYYVNLA